MINNKYRAGGKNKLNKKWLIVVKDNLEVYYEVYKYIVKDKQGLKWLNIII